MGRQKAHHYVPVSYLARFTRSGTAEGKLWVFDTVQGGSWPSNPRDCAHKRDYNLIEAPPDMDPLFFEKEGFGAIETSAKLTFDDVIGRGHEALERHERTVPTSDDQLET